MTLNTEIRLGDLTAIGAFLIASTGLFLNLCQLRKDAKRKRADFLISLFKQYWADEGMTEIFYGLEYGTFRYGPDFHGSSKEKQLDRLLQFFEMIENLYQMEVITRVDLELIRYQFVRVYQNEQVQMYFKFLDGLPRAIGVSGGAFKRFRNVAESLAADEAAYARPQQARP